MRRRDSHRVTILGPNQSIPRREIHTRRQFWRTAVNGSQNATYTAFLLWHVIQQIFGADERDGYRPDKLDQQICCRY